MTLTLTPDELAEITGYSQPHKQLAELHRLGFSRARRDRLGRVVLERAHYDAVATGGATQAPPRPKVRLLKAA